MSVSTGPGATAFTRTPKAAASNAADLVIPSTACLLPAYSDIFAAPRSPMVEEMLTMLPLPWACMTRNSCFMLSNVPNTLVSKLAA